MITNSDAKLKKDSVLNVVKSCPSVVAGSFDHGQRLNLSVKTGDCRSQWQAVLKR